MEFPKAHFTNGYQIIERSKRKQKGLTLRNFNLLEAKVKRLEDIIEIIKKANVWSITFFKCNGKSYYICVIIDLYARKVIADKVGKKNSTQLIKTTFKKVYERRQPLSSLIFHTDRGANHCSKTLNDYIKTLGVTRSFSRPYVLYDNSVIESFFVSLKREELYR